MKDQIEKQAIEEMACDMCTVILNCNEPCEPIPSCHAYQHAKKAYAKGYRKQSEGEWKITRTGKRIYIKCTRCNYTKLFDRLESITDERKYIINDFIDEHNFCPNCGAKMKGGAE